MRLCSGFVGLSFAFGNKIDARIRSFPVGTVYRPPTFHHLWNKLLFFDLCHKTNCCDFELFHLLKLSSILVKNQLPERMLSLWLMKTNGTNNAETFVLFFTFCHLFCSQHETPFLPLLTIPQKFSLESSPGNLVSDTQTITPFRRRKISQNFLSTKHTFIFVQSYSRNCIPQQDACLMISCLLFFEKSISVTLKFVETFIWKVAQVFLTVCFLISYPNPPPHSVIKTFQSKKQLVALISINNRPRSQMLERAASFSLFLYCIVVGTVRFTKTSLLKRFRFDVCLLLFVHNPNPHFRHLHPLLRAYQTVLASISVQLPH